MGRIVLQYKCVSLLDNPNQLKVWRDYRRILNHQKVLLKRRKSDLFFLKASNDV